MDGWWAVSYVMLWGLVIALCLVVVALARQIGTLHMRLGPRGALEMDDEGPELGSEAPPIPTHDITGEPVVIGGADQLLMFVSPGCHVCEQVLPSVGAVAEEGRLAPYVITDVDEEETTLTFKHKRVAAPVVPGIGVAQAYEVPGTPYVVIVDRDGLVAAKGTVNNLEQIEGLIDSARRRSTEGFHPERETSR
ncbi:MAG TPA: thiol-disulfide isomerase [Actinomycetota bacterium]|nr:thiol-disulfide isomerase [Actinomycetota bacterium]